MLTKNISFKNFSKKTKIIKLKKILKSLLKENLDCVESLKNNYEYSYSKNQIKKYKKFPDVRIIGIGGSILGAEAIYGFLKNKIKKNFLFINNLKSKNNYLENKKKFLNLIISKSGNTLETISNVNILIKKKDKNIFILENNNNYLNNLAKKLKSDVIEHNNFIGGRYSVLSEVGMLPAELMGLNENKFKNFNNLIKNKNFVNNLLNNVNNTVSLVKKGNLNSIILNYDEGSENFFKWYQQLLAESLGKKAKGILPVISSMPKDNHSLMQLYLDGPKKSFFTFFYVFNNSQVKIKNQNIISNYNYLKNKNIDQIIFAQKRATEKVFIKKKIPFRSFEINERSEKSIGELFCFFILETILIGRVLNLNPFDQPSVELIKNETKKFLL